MACKYIYKGHIFDSELLLDNFLLTNAKYIDKYGDLAFSATTRLLDNDIKIQELAKQNEIAKKEYDELRRKGHFTRDEDGDMMWVSDGTSWRYTGVNRFLGEQHHKYNKDSPLYPYFDGDNYFIKNVNNRFDAWARGEFNDIEKEVFFDNDDSKVRPISSRDEQNKYREYLETKWNIQARIGDAVHKVFETFFSKDASGVNIRTYSDLELFNYVKSKLAEPIKDYPGGLLTFMSLNNDADLNIQNAINTAKAFYDSLPKEWGDCIFYPEYSITGHATNDNGKDYKLFGIVDLLVLDKDGNFHIIDYKTSIKEYGQFDTAKQRAYSYLLSTYYQMLENAGIAIQGADLYIAPIQIKDFKKTAPDLFNTYQYDGLNYQGLQQISGSRALQLALANIEEFMPSKYAYHITTGEMYEEVTGLVEKCFAKDAISKEVDEESTKQYLDRKNAFKKKDENGKYTFTMRTATLEYVTFTTETKEEMILKVMAERKKLIPARHNSFLSVKKALKDGTSKGDPNVEFPESFVNKAGATNWLRHTLAPYCNGLWKVVDVPGFDDLEIIALYNDTTKQTDFVGISTNNLYRQFNKTRNHVSLVGKFETDAQAELHHKRLVLESLVGNIEAMQIMWAINASQGFEHTKIGNIQVINAYDAELVNPSNEELLTNFNILNKYVPVKENKFDSGKYQLASYYDKLEKRLTDIWHIGETTDWKDPELKDYKINLKPAKDAIDKARDGSLEDKVNAVQQLLYDMRTRMKLGDSMMEDYEGQEKLKSRKKALYDLASYTLLELKNIHLRLQTSDHHKWFSNILQTFTEGLSGNYTDNPGNLDSETLNLITSLVKEAYQNVRDDIQNEKPNLDKHIEALKRSVGFTKLKESIGFNLADLYKKLFVVKNIDGVEDLHFAFIDDVEPEYRPLLDYVLKTINRNRLNKTEEELERMQNTRDCTAYYQVPLIEGGLDSKVSASPRGLTGLLADKLKFLNPGNWKAMYSDAVEGVKETVTNLRDKEDKSKAQQSANLIYQIENAFEKSEENRVEAILRMGGVLNAERNIETLVLKHLFTYSQTKHINAVFPLILAAAAHLSILGANANTVFEADKSYLEDYIRSKIKKESIVLPELLGIAKALGKLKSAASMLTLAFAPVQMFYLPLQGLWTDIRLMIQKPDGKTAFTFEHFKNSFKILFEDLFNFSGKPTLSSLLNEWYALNDMDINKYIDAISGSRKGLFYNFQGMAFRAASRPDYYNRLSIFLSQMQADGCLEAHEIKDGKLVYDWTKDKRFSKFAEAVKNGNPNSADPEVTKLRALYYAVAQLFVNEGATNEDGTLFELDMNNPKPLPRAYTVRQAEGYKSLADDIYGYYSEENKSLIQATALGSMWLQFKTYWSGKKNQYLQSGGIRMRGSWEAYTEIEKDSDGNEVVDPATGQPKVIEYYYDLNEDGSINHNKIVKKEELSPDKLLAPVMLWKGQWQEGILVTVSKLCKDWHIINNYNQLMMEDPDMARCYKSNIIQLIYDTLLFGVGGCIIGGAMTGWLKDLLKENKDNTDFMTGLGLAAANVAVRTVRNSFLDFNIADSLGGPLTEWTPFAISFASSTISNLYKTATGDLDIIDALSNSTGVTRQIKPFIDTLKPEMFRTKQEGGTWESSTSKKNREKRESL